jgi:hypothetical protein
VEGGERPGLPDSWYGSGYSFEERMRRWLMRELPTYSYDSLNEIVSLARDRREPCQLPREAPRTTRRLRPMAPPEGFNLVYIFHRLAAHYFQWVGNSLCVKEERLGELHELALRFPIRHLIRYCHADAVCRGYITMERALELPVRIGLLHTTYQGLRTLAERGLSEGHLHLNGVINADEGWADQLLRRSSPGAHEGFTPDADRLLVLSRTAVQLLAVGMLYTVMGITAAKDIPFHLLQRLDRMYRARNPLEDREARKGLSSEFLDVFKGLREHGGVMERQENQLYWLLKLANPGMERLWFRDREHLRRLEAAEPRGVRRRIRLLERLHLAVQRFLVERNVRSAFIDPSLERGVPPVREENDLKEKYKPIREFIHQVYIRCLIYHTHHWQRATQSGMTTGLRNFNRFLNAPQRALTPWSMDWEGLAVEQLSQASPLRDIEGRLSPPRGGARDYLPWVLAFARQAGNKQLDKFGIVVHFRKEDHPPLEQKRSCRFLLDLRYGKSRRITRADAFKLFRLLSTPNPMVPFIVGIDAANLELATPPEVFAPAFRFLRDYPIELLRRPTTREIFGEHDAVESLVKERRLGMTYHVGEDFRHLLSGLRAIHEVIEFLKPLPGDRLGHAIALGLDPQVWASRVGYQAVLPRQEWLDDLVWIHNLLGPGHDLIGELAVEDSIQRYSRQIYGHIKEERNGCGKLDLTQPTLYDSWRLRQLDPYSIDTSRLVEDRFLIRFAGQGTAQKRWTHVQKKVLKEVDRYIGMNSAYRLLKFYWYHPEVRRIGSQCITVDMKKDKKLWLQVCYQVQERLQTMVRERQLVVEVNPSSNRVVGQMSQMAEHPIFRLTLDRENRLSREGRVTINTDDPGIFATSLAHEFYLLGEIMLSRGVSEAEVVRWLEWLRKNGRDYSFLQTLPDAADRRIQAILRCLLDRYGPLVSRLCGEKRKYIPPALRTRSKWKESGKVEDTQQIDQLKTTVRSLLDRIRTLEAERG